MGLLRGVTAMFINGFPGWNPGRSSRVSDHCFLSKAFLRPSHKVATGVKKINKEKIKFIFLVGIKGWQELGTLSGSEIMQSRLIVHQIFNKLTKRLR